MSLRERVEGNELDLSLNQLTEVPVKELALATKATHLDLSCNLIETLPNEFASLVHLVKIDLSKNKLKILPPNFGNLVSLQYLDLYENEIQRLPLSLYKLKKLEWLDLKKNPLVPSLQKVAGDCLDGKDCRACAKNIVSFFQNRKREFDLQEEKKLNEAREKEAEEKAKKEREIEEERRRKKYLKEQKRLELKMQEKSEKQDKSGKEECSAEELAKSLENKENRSSFRISDLCGQATFIILGISILLFCGVFFLIDEKYQNIEYFKETAEVAINKIMLKTQNLSSEARSLIILYFPKVRTAFLKSVHSCMEIITFYTSLLEETLAVYF